MRTWTKIVTLTALLGLVATLAVGNAAARDFLPVTTGSYSTTPVEKPAPVLQLRRSAPVSQPGQPAQQPASLALVESTSNGTDWGRIGIGVAIGTGCLVAIGLALGTVRRRRPAAA